MNTIQNTITIYEMKKVKFEENASCGIERTAKIISEQLKMIIGMNDAYGVSRAFLRNRWGIRKIGGRMSVAIVMVLWKKVIRRKEEQRDAAKTGAAVGYGKR